MVVTISSPLKKVGSILKSCKLTPAVVVLFMPSLIRPGELYKAASYKAPAKGVRFDLD
ncbi:MAG: hypothetical protein CM15mV26_1060 [uncultured marine virus]|nr:MAG: hypothetical protein CM15mV26_1060 [uncultured marine virus]